MDEDTTNGIIVLISVHKTKKSSSALLVIYAFGKLFRVSIKSSSTPESEQIPFVVRNGWF